MRQQEGEGIGDAWASLARTIEAVVNECATDLEKVRTLISKDGRIMRMLTEHRDGPVTYVYAAPKNLPARRDVVDQVRTLNQLLDSIELVLADLGMKPGKRPFFVQSDVLHFGQLLVDEAVLCLFPSIGIAQARLSLGASAPLSVGIADLR